MSDTMSNYIYLLHEREFIKSKENVYKVGMTKKDNLVRFNQYPNGSVLLIQLICNNCKLMETHIIKKFKECFKQKKEYGNEYFEGNYITMIDIIYYTIKNEMCDDETETTDEINTNNKILETTDEIDTNNEIEYYNHNKELKTTYFCNNCDFVTSKLTDYTRHSLTQKHARNTLATTSTTKCLQCEMCNRLYKNRSGLWRHKIKGACSINISNNEDNVTNNPDDFLTDKQLIINLLQQNGELQKSLIEISKEKTITI